ncbi:interleukin-12 subunit beta [Onychostruthus taczanowskii]|uniref:interleukin-12 subunit beta n=1 Tax=Onychostruthus taczanowskii TaxID=356909 RepID=UPI001B8021EC|nr:interleukin-12 subunit beta [Onychostruthus taczanowskii]
MRRNNWMDKPLMCCLPMSPLLCALLSLFSFAALLESAQWKLQENVFVIDSQWDAEAPATTVELSCASPEEAVYWRKDSSPFQEGKQRGKTLRVAVKELPDAGNYSCVSEESHRVLSSILLLMARISPSGHMMRDILRAFEEPNRTFLKCEAKNYSGIFTCSWMTDYNPNVKFTIRSLEGPQGDVSCSSPVAVTEGALTTYTAQCHKESFCPFAEEQQPIDITLEAIDEVLYENYSASFFIRDIIKPDPPQCQYVASNGTVTWTYPRTWSTPNSYFPLTFKVKVKSTKRHRYQVYDTEEQWVQLPAPGPAEVWVQARDCCYLSSWSQWSSPCR